MEGQLNLDCERFQQITQMAKMGWWESDVKNQQYICSDFIVDLLGLESHRISFKEFTTGYAKITARVSETNLSLIQILKLMSKCSLSGLKRRNMGIFQDQFQKT